MPKNYMYRMHHDLGFAPNVDHGICSLGGCKRTTVERWAHPGSWVIGIGGKRTSTPDKLRFAMKVDYNLSYNDFREKYPLKSQYLRLKHKATNVLVSESMFYYFGDQAIYLSAAKLHIGIDRQGCKCVSDEDINTLMRYFSEKKLKPGKLGNSDPSTGVSKPAKKRVHSK